MSVRNGIVLFLAVFALSFLFGCGSSSPKAVAPPSGAFSNSNLNGTYVFSSTGFDVNGGFLTMVGTLAANGSGGITGGTIDVTSADSAVGVSSNVPITGGSYSITADGRGQASLNNGTPLGTIILDFVLSSNSHGLVTEFDGNGTGSGTLDLQSAVSQSQLAGSYAFGISGAGSTSSFATVGSLTLNSTGGVTAGFEDFNNGGSPTTDQPISTSSFVTVGTGTSPGTAQLSTSVGTFAFDVYAIDSSHLKFIETDNQLILSGDAYTLATSLPTSGTLAFTMSGADTADSSLALGGLIPLDASSNVVAGGVEDFNDNGTVGQDAMFSGGFSPLSGGRSVLTLTSFVNGAANDLTGTYTFAAYPFTSNGVSGVLLLEIDSAVPFAVTAGTAYLQTSTTIAASQGYGFNLSAINIGNGSGAFEEDDIAEFQTTSTGFSGIVDINNQGSTSFKQALSGSYQAGGTGRYTATTTEHGNTFVSFTFYVVNASTFILLETDSNQIGTGVFELQNVSSTPGIAQPVITMARPTARAQSSMRHK